MLSPLTAFLIFAGATAVTVLILTLAENKKGAKARREDREYVSWHREARRLRVAELAADPARAHYAPLVERGEDWAEENIRYYENPEETITCIHLREIEKAMRRAGVSARRYREADITTKCCIDFEALKREFEAAEPVRYCEFYVAERAEHDHPMAYLMCDEHKCMIYTVHPENQKAQEALWFPRGNVRRL